jgi:tetratricopeptide (TPR) repeat protein
MIRLVILSLILFPLVTLAQSPQAASHYNQLGKAAVLRNDSAQAGANFEQALAIDSNSQTARVGYALSHRNAKAYDILTDMLSIAPEDTSTHIVRAYCALAIERQSKKAGNYNETDRWLGRALEDYRWLLDHNTNPMLTQAHIDEAEAIWNGTYTTTAPLSKNVPADSEAPNNQAVVMPIAAQPIIGNVIEHTGLNRFMTERMTYNAIGSPVYTKLKNGDVKVKYQFEGIKPGSEDVTVTSLTYTLPAGASGRIKKLSISGNRAAVEQLFVTYWPTSATPQTIKQRRVVSYQLLNDNITYASYNPAMANITIVKKR